MSFILETLLYDTPSHLCTIRPSSSSSSTFHSNSCFTFKCLIWLSDPQQSVFKYNTNCNRTLKICSIYSAVLGTNKQNFNRKPTKINSNQCPTPTCSNQQQNTEWNSATNINQPQTKSTNTLLSNLIFKEWKRGILWLPSYNLSSWTWQRQTDNAIAFFIEKTNKLVSNLNSKTTSRHGYINRQPMTTLTIDKILVGYVELSPTMPELAILYILRYLWPLSIKAMYFLSYWVFAFGLNFCKFIITVTTG